MVPFRLQINYLIDNNTSATTVGDEDPSCELSDTIGNRTKYEHQGKIAKKFLHLEFTYTFFHVSIQRIMLFHQ